MPAASSGARSSLRFGGACRCTSAGRTSRAAAIDHRNSSGGHGVGACASRCPAWAGSSGRSPPARDRARACAFAIATSASIRSARVSPMPTRMPVVNGTRARPGGVERREPALGRLVGRAVVRAAGLAEPRRERLDHHPLRRAHRAQPRRARPATSAPALAWGSSPVSSSTQLARPRRGSRRSTRSRAPRATRPPAGSAPRAPRPA